MTVQPDVCAARCAGALPGFSDCVGGRESLAAAAAAALLDVAGHETK